MEKVRFKTLVWKFKETTLNYPNQSAISKKRITAPSDAFDLFNPLFKEEPTERFIVILLSNCNRVIGYDIVSTGTLNSSVVDPRGVFRSAIVANSANIIICHNHPSGNLEPSNEDITITNLLVEAGKIIGINIFDHIIFAENRFASFVERGLI